MSVLMSLVSLLKQTMLVCNVKAMNHNASNMIQKQKTKASDGKHNSH